VRIQGVAAAAAAVVVAVPCRGGGGGDGSGKHLLEHCHCRSDIPACFGGVKGQVVLAKKKKKKKKTKKKNKVQHERRTTDQEAREVTVCVCSGLQTFEFICARPSHPAHAQKNVERIPSNSFSF
jgi:hypothetical protein